jgi:A/G-specific adenine glycosylase
MTSGTEGPPPGVASDEPADAQLEEVRRVVLGASSDLWRDLPWRSTRDAWLVLVSEVMLQQTQACRVVDPWRRFVTRFPTPGACAAAGAAAVVRAWAGLGYNRRASNLHRTAVIIVDRHGGQVPDQLEALLDLPGVGPYTARAVLAFAYGRAVGAVDTNVVRVLSRAVAGRPLAGREAQRLADRLVPQGDGAWRFNQALFDLGARCCTARAPRCAVCPLGASCRWTTSGGGADGSWTLSADPGAGRRRQGVFAGSDREGRGRLVGALRSAPVPTTSLAAATGWPDDEVRARRIARVLVDEGLACWREDALVLA